MGIRRHAPLDTGQFVGVFPPHRSRLLDAGRGRRGRRNHSADPFTSGLLMRLPYNAEALAAMTAHHLPVRRKPDRQTTEEHV